MIAFDNGPAGGDYVRYIDDLMKRGAIAASAGVLPSPTSSDRSGTLGQTRDRLAAAAAGSRTGDAASDAFRPDGRTGFATPVAPTAGAAAAAAIASALASGQTGAGPAIRTMIGLAAIALGIVLLVVGLIAPLNVVVIVGGGVLIAWAVRTMRGAASRG